jgi:hypothetical protein
MRRALGLHNASPTQDRPVPPLTSPGASSPQRRRFVRDGEVPFSVIRRDQDDGANTNKLDATRQALREQIEARGRRSTGSRRLRRRSPTSRRNWPMTGSPGMRRSSVWTARSSLSNRLSRWCRGKWPWSGPAGRRPGRNAMTPLQPLRRPRTGREVLVTPRVPGMRPRRHQGPRVIRRRPGGRGSPCRRLPPLPAAIR